MFSSLCCGYARGSPDVTFSIYGDNPTIPPGNPDSLLGTFLSGSNIPAYNSGGGNTDLTTVSSTGVTLTAGSVYYLLASASPDTEAIAWQLSSTDGNHYIYGYDQYGNFYNGLDGYENMDAFQLQKTTAMPESVSLILLGSCLLGLAGVARRRFLV